MPDIKACADAVGVPPVKTTQDDPARSIVPPTGCYLESTAILLVRNEKGGNNRQPHNSSTCPLKAKIPVSGAMSLDWFSGITGLK